MNRSDAVDERDGDWPRITFSDDQSERRHVLSPTWGGMIRAILLTALVALAVMAPQATAVAHPRATLIGCGWHGAVAFSPAPRSCFLDWPNLSLAKAVTLRRIHWRYWGHREATARAVFRIKTYDPWTHVRVRASRRRRCHDAELYTRVRVWFPNGYVHTWRVAPCSAMP